MTTTIFPAEFPGAVVMPADDSNYGYRGATPDYKAFVIHTPEEPADDYEVTPDWFADPRANASTHLYADNDGDIIQMVPFAQGAWAHGVRNYVSRTRIVARHWKGQDLVRPPWAPSGSYNLQAIGCEVEGYAGSIHRTLKINGPQWNSLVSIIRWCGQLHPEFHISGFPIDRDHIVGHSELVRQKGDPGRKFPWDDLMESLTVEPTDEVQLILSSLDVIEAEVRAIRRWVKTT